MTPLEIGGAAAIVMMGAILQGSVGFGLGMLAAPLLVLIDPDFVPAPLLSAAFGLTLLIARRERKSIDFRGIGWALVGRLPGTFLGAIVAATAAQKTTSILVGVVVFAAVAMIGSGATLRRTPAVLFGAGTVSGFMGTTTSIGGPPIAALYHDAEGAKIRGTMSGFFVVGLTITLVALAAVGRYGPHELYLAGCIFPGAIIGYLVSGHVAPVLDRGYTRVAVLTASALAGLSVIVQALVTSQ